MSYELLLVGPEPFLKESPQRDIFFDIFCPGCLGLFAFRPPFHRIKFAGKDLFKSRNHNAFHQRLFPTGNRTEIYVNLFHVPAFDLFQKIQINFDESFEVLTQQRFEGVLGEPGAHLLKFFK